MDSFAQPAMHAVIIVPYDRSWVERAADETSQLAEALSSNLARIEHFGSTSVPGLAAKPIIDLMPLVVSLDDLDCNSAAIEMLGFAWHGEFGIKGRRFCTKTGPNGVRLVNLHCFQVDSSEVERHLAFRDYLRAHPAVAREYEIEKHRAAALHPNDSRAYNDEKWAWVERVEADALKWHAARGEVS
jgi:GrpB-like predicted nucleotidyltransferase (UPF0157 family)